MANTSLDRYLETEALNADPVKLIRMLYRGALDAVAAARRALARTNDSTAVMERSRHIVKAWRIVNELRSSLDYAQGTQVSRQLAELYVYIEQRLLDGNIQQADVPLAEAEALLTTLLEAWNGLASVEHPMPAERAPVSVAC